VQWRSCVIPSAKSRATRSAARELHGPQSAGARTADVVGSPCFIICVELVATLAAARLPPNFSPGAAKQAHVLLAQAEHIKDVVAGSCAVAAEYKIRPGNGLRAYWFLEPSSRANTSGERKHSHRPGLLVRDYRAASPNPKCYREARELRSRCSTLAEGIHATAPLTAFHFGRCGTAVKSSGM